MELKMGRVRIENESERGVAGRKGGNKRGVAGVILGEAQGQRGAHIAAPTGPAEESWPLLRFGETGLPLFSRRAQSRSRRN